MSDRWKSNPWDGTSVATLRRLWPDPNLTCAKIAVLLGTGVSRCAVIGKGKRLGLGPKPSNSPHDTSHVPKPRQRKPRRSPTKPFVSKFRTVSKRERFIPRAANIVSREFDVLELTDVTCKWPSGDPQTGIPYTFCGHPIEPGMPYCPSHCVIAYEPRAKRKEAA
ncbi:MAG: GcrA family cell cycle regulator [Nitrospiraceae bacterium]